MSADEAIVLVGGLGTRLRGVVSDLPKPLAPVAGRPFLAWLLDHLAGTGVRRVILAAGYMAEKVQQAIGSQWQSLQVDYSVESQPLGTGGALRQACTMLDGNAVHLLNGDTFLRYQPDAMADAVHAAGGRIGMALAEVPDVSRYGAVHYRDGRVTGFCEKGLAGAGYINAGCYFLTEAALAALPAEPQYSFEERVLGPASEAGSVCAYLATSGFIDISVPDDYERAQSLFAGAR